MTKLICRTGLCLPLMAVLLCVYSCRKPNDVIAVAFPLKVINASPATTETGSPYDGLVSVTFNDVVDTNRYAVSLSIWQNDTLIAGATKVDDSTLHFLSLKDLKTSSLYNANVSIAYKGDTTAAYRYQWNFTTKAPDEYSMTQRTTQVTDFVRDGSRCMQIDDYFYSFGGWTDNGGEVTYNDVYRSAGDLSKWTRVQSAPWPARHVFGCVKKDGKVWIMGGDNLYTDFDVWNSADGLNWNKIGESNPVNVGARSYIGCTIHKIGREEWIYVMGGFYHRDVVRSRNGITWEKVADNLSFLGGPAIPAGEGWSGSLTSLNGALYLVCGGGSISDGPSRKEVWRSADNGFTWTRQSDFPGPSRRYTDVIAYDGKIWVVGGFDDYQAINLADIWYMSNSGTWRQLNVPPDYIGRHATGIGVYNNQLVITCGNYNNDCWVIQKVR